LDSTESPKINFIKKLTDAIVQLTGLNNLAHNRLEREFQESVEKISKRLQTQEINTQRELDNLRKDMAQIISIRENLLVDILQNFLDFRRLITDKNMANDLEALTRWSDGIQIVFRQMQALIKRQGIQEYSAQNLKYDPSLHEIVKRQESETVEPGMIIEEIEPGFISADTKTPLVRAKVIISISPKRRVK